MKSTLIFTAWMAACLTATAQNAPSSEPESTLAQVEEKIASAKSKHPILQAMDRPAKEASLQESARRWLALAAAQGHSPAARKLAEWNADRGEEKRPPFVAAAGGSTRGRRLVPLDHSGRD